MLLHQIDFWEYALKWPKIHLHNVIQWVSKCQNTKLDRLFDIWIYDL
jgi:hypothetical protein